MLCPKMNVDEATYKLLWERAKVSFTAQAVLERVRFERENQRRIKIDIRELYKQN